MANKNSKADSNKVEKMAKSVVSNASKKPAKEKSPKDKSSFGKDFKAELKRVTWPTPKQLVNNTTAVVVIVLITAAVVFILDVIFENLNKYGVEGLKSVVTNTSVDTNTVVETSTVDSQLQEATDASGETIYTTEASTETPEVTESAE